MIRVILLFCIFFISLSSGANENELKVLRITKIITTTGEEALLLKYESNISVSNVPELKKEVLEIWKKFQIDVEKQNMDSAVIQAANTYKSFGILSQSKTYGFVFKKSKDGKWEQVESPS